MLYVGQDFIETDSSFDIAMKSGPDGKIWIRAQAPGGTTIGNPYPVIFRGSDYVATDMTASLGARLGIAEKTVASGCVGWIQIRGKYVGAQATESFNGSYGHAVYWGGATGIGATDSAFIGAVHQIGVLVDDVSGGGSTTANIWLTGALAQSL